MDSRSKGNLENMVREEEEYEVNHDKKVVKTSKVFEGDDTCVPQPSFVK
jgi:hypothetical protein